MNDIILTAENVANTNAKELAVAEDIPKPLTRAEIGKLRRHYITVVHGTVKACGHGFDPKRPPKRNCEDCWTAYFFTAVDTAAVHDDLMKGGKKKLQAVYGDVFTKAFGRFLHAQMMQEITDGEQAGSNDSSEDKHISGDICSDGACGETASGHADSGTS